MAAEPQNPVRASGTWNSDRGDAVTTTGIIVMILVTGFVWGGLAFILVKAARKERAKEEGEGLGGA